MKKVLILYVSVHHGNTRQLVGKGRRNCYPNARGHLAPDKWENCPTYSPHSLPLGGNVGRRSRVG